MEIDAKDGSGFVLATAGEAAQILSASSSHQGWLGGLDRALELLQLYPSIFSDKIRELGIQPQSSISQESLRLLSISGHGLRQCRLENVPKYSCYEAFGGDVRTQLIGKTICAVSHELQSLSATRMVLDCMLPKLVGPNVELLQGLRLSIFDRGCIRRIINEGHARGLNDAFSTLAEALRLPRPNSAWISEILNREDELTEGHLVGGMLKWVVSTYSETYYTRSPLTVRVALYLREVGYPINVMIGETGEQSSSSGAGKSLVYIDDDGPYESEVGFHMSDYLRLKACDIVIEPPTLIYRYQTVGSMLAASFGHHFHIDPEAFQRHFESIYSYLKSSLTTHFCLGAHMLTLGVRIKGRANRRRPQHRRLTRRLAQIYFPSRSAFFAPCYDHIATRTLVDIVEEDYQCDYPFDIMPVEIARFRAITAAIVIGFLGTTVHEDFQTTQHRIEVCLIHPYWLSEMCRFIDKASANRIGYSDLVRAVSVIHCASNFEYVEKDSLGESIAWRTGIFSVLPSIMIDLSTSVTGLNIRLIDKFWANVIPDDSGAITSGFTPLFQGRYDYDANDSTILRRPGIELELPWLDPPDVQIELDFERPLHYYGPHVSLIGRVNGEAIAGIGILQLLRKLLHVHSFEPDFPCPGHDDNMEVDQTGDHRMVIARTSFWKDLGSAPAPLVQHRYTYVPAQGDEHWALFLVGYGSSYVAKVIRGCARCMEMSKPRLSGCVLVIGIGQTNDGRIGEREMEEV